MYQIIEYIDEDIFENIGIDATDDQYDSYEDENNDEYEPPEYHNNFNESRSYEAERLEDEAMTERMHMRDKYENYYGDDENDYEYQQNAYDPQEMIYNDDGSVEYW